MDIFASGILFRNKERVFLIQRSDNGEWAVPGGKVDPGETEIAAARREVMEECGIDCDVPLTPLSVINGFVTYLADNWPIEFTATLNDESLSSGWFDLTDLPSPLHPGLVATLAQSALTETQVGEMIASGTLSSPQFYRNMYLWKIRVTGTGIAWRSKGKEFFYRDPANYLTPEFLNRVAGVPLIWMHPDKNKLDSEEFAQRVVGTLTNSWVQNDEVWSIARVYDTDAAEEMMGVQLSTSPTVIFDKSQVDVVNFDGDQIMLEDTPTYIDHVAICQAGVWDKLASPAGIQSDSLIEVQEMAELTKEDVANIVCDVLDARDKKAKEKADAEEKEREAKEKADAEEAEKKEKADADLRNEIQALKSRMGEDLTDEENNEIADAQVKADSVYASIGERAPRPLHGEKPMSYRRRVLVKLQKMSSTFKDINLAELTTPGMLQLAEKTIFADAQEFVSQPGNGITGLREVRRDDGTGRRISTFVGDAGAAWAPFAMGTRKVLGFNNQR